MGTVRAGVGEPAMPADHDEFGEGLVDRPLVWLATCFGCRGWSRRLPFRRVAESVCMPLICRRGDGEMRCRWIPTAASNDCQGRLLTASFVVGTTSDASWGDTSVYSRRASPRFRLR